MTRRRLVRPGVCRLFGRAWSGRGAVTEVQLSVDGGRSWADAVLEEPVDRHAWQAWSFVWSADTLGDYELCCRATDASGETQPLAPPWNAGGYTNNAVQRVAVTVGAHL